MIAIALDDEWPALDIIDAFCQRLSGIQLLKTFIRPDQARQFLTEHSVDLLFLDINMPDETGLHFARTVGQQPLIVFTTAYSDYALESYDVQAVDYLLKPFTFERFTQAVQRVQTRLTTIKAEPVSSPNAIEPPHVFFRVGHGLKKVILSDILFIEGLDNYLKIRLVGNKSVVVRLTFANVQTLLSSDNFVRVHRSYLVALDKIDGVQGKGIQIGDEQIPIGIHYEKEFFRRFKP